MAFAIATQDDHQTAIDTQALQGRHRGPHIGALAVVKEFNAVQDRDGGHTVRLPCVFAQAEQHGSQVTASVARQRQSRQSIQCVMSATNAQRISRHQTLDMNFFLFVLRRDYLGGTLFALCFIRF